jgi:hypothetical protein
LANDQIEPIIDFSKYISERTQDFTGREWVFQAVNHWLADPEGARFFLITGEPGSGKTAIASRLSQFSSNSKTTWPADDLPQLKLGFLSAIHFCSARDTDWRNPQTFAKSIALQMAGQERYAVFTKALAEKRSDIMRIEAKLENVTAHGKNAKITAVHIGNIEIKGAPTEDVFNRLIREPLQVLFDESPKEQVIILVDALDEALVYGGDVNIVSLLADSQNLPKGVRFIITSRKDERVENRFFGAAGLYLSDTQFNEQNQYDTRSYTKKRFSNDKKLASKVNDREQEQLDDLVKKITLKADGNFQYITFLLKSISSDYQNLEEIDRLPPGLDALYYESLGRLITQGSNDWSNYSSLLGTLSIAQEGLTQSTLQNFTGLSESVLWECLGRLDQFIETIVEDEFEDNIHRNEKQEEYTYRLYHQSFVDFLHGRYIAIETDREKKKLRNSYYLSAKDWHKKIVERYYYFKGIHKDILIDIRTNAYFLKYLSPHLFSLRDEETYCQKLFALARDDEYAAAQYKYLDNRPDLPLSTLRMALHAAAERDYAVMITEFLLMHAQRFKKTLSPFDALRDSNNLKLAWSLADLHDADRRTLLYLLILWELKDFGKLKEAHMTIERLLQKDLSQLKEEWQCEYACFILSQISDIDKEALLAICKKVFGKNCLRKAIRMVKKGTPREELDEGNSTDGFPNIHLAETSLDDKIARTKESLRAAAQAVEKKIMTVSSPETDVTEMIFSGSNGLLTIAETQGRIGDKEGAKQTFDAVVKVVNKINDEASKGIRLKFVVEALVRAGYFTDALKTAERIDHSNSKLEAMLSIAIEQIRAGDKETACITLNSAVREIDHVKDDFLDMHNVSYVMIALAKVGLFSDALKIAERMGSTYLGKDYVNNERAHTILQIAMEQAKAGDKEGAKQTFHIAVKTANEINGIIERSQRILQIAMEQAKAGDAKAARVTLDTVFMVNNRQMNLTQDAMSADIAEALARIRNFGCALEIAKRIENGYIMANAILQIAMEQAKAGDKEGAKQTFHIAVKAAETADSQDSPMSFMEGQDLWIAQMYAKGGYVKEAEKMFDEISIRVGAITPLGLGYKPTVFQMQRRSGNRLKGVALAQAKVGFFDSAFKTAARISVDYIKKETTQEIQIMRDLVANLNGTFSESLTILSMKSKPAHNLLQIAMEQAKAGDKEGAKQNLSKIIGLFQASRKFRSNDVEDMEEDLLYHITIAHAQLGLGEQAVSLIETIDADRTKYIIGAAEALTQKNDKDNLKKLLALSAYYVGAAYRMCGFVAKIYPVQSEEIAKIAYDH